MNVNNGNYFKVAGYYYKHKISRTLFTSNRRSKISLKMGCSKSKSAEQDEETVETYTKTDEIKEETTKNDSTSKLDNRCVGKLIINMPTQTEKRSFRDLIEESILQNKEMQLSFSFGSYNGAQSNSSTKIVQKDFCLQEYLLYN